jgi:hypothetical protein
MVEISNADAATVLALLERGARFYQEHAVHTRDQDTGRLMAKMAKKLKVNRVATESRPKKTEQS